MRTEQDTEPDTEPTPTSRSFGDFDRALFIVPEIARLVKQLGGDPVDDLAMVCHYCGAIASRGSGEAKSRAKMLAEECTTVAYAADYTDPLHGDHVYGGRDIP